MTKSEHDLQRALTGIEKLQQFLGNLTLDTDVDHEVAGELHDAHRGLSDVTDFFKNHLNLNGRELRKISPLVTL